MKAISEGGTNTWLIVMSPNCDSHQKPRKECTFTDRTGAQFSRYASLHAQTDPHNSLTVLLIVLLSNNQEIFGQSAFEPRQAVREGDQGSGTVEEVVTIKQRRG